IKPRNELSPCIIETEDEFDDIDQITILENIEEVIGDNEDLIEIISCILDPQFKKLRFISETIKIQIYEELQMIDDDDNDYKKRKKLILDDIYNNSDKPDKNENELDTYLSLDEEGRNTDPFDWLFSDVGNNITAKRSNLKPNLV
ncbi:6576_t:CDS:2, partial [Funneliformis geosporum]